MTLPTTMAAVLLTGHGGLDKLHYRTDVAVPRPAAGEVLIRVAAAGVNNTDINTRTAWYAKSDTDTAGGWSGALQFPRIQGADLCGRIVAVGDGVPARRIGERVLVRSMQRDPADPRPWACRTIGSEYDGGFAQYAAVPSAETYAVRCSWSDAELASIPCAYSTAENLLHRAEVGADANAETVLITGASGGVGSAAVQLAKRRGATVVALAGAAKRAQVEALGAHRVLARDADLMAEPGAESVDVVIDLVGGAGWPALLEVLRRGGRYAVAGAIAGPLVELDLRTLYLKDLSFFGCTRQPPEVFENLIRYIERDEIRPLVARTYPLSEIAAAQTDFVTKKHTGKLVLLPPDTS